MNGIDALTLWLHASHEAQNAADVLKLGEHPQGDTEAQVHQSLGAAERFLTTALESVRKLRGFPTPPENPSSGP